MGSVTLSSKEWTRMPGCYPFFATSRKIKEFLPENNIIFADDLYENNQDIVQMGKQSWHNRKKLVSLLISDFLLSYRKWLHGRLARLQ